MRIRCGENVSFMNADPHHRTHVAVGGKENAVKLYDIERHDAGPVFQAKNVCELTFHNIHCTLSMISQSEIMAVKY